LTEHAPASARRATQPTATGSFNRHWASDTKACITKRRNGKSDWKYDPKHSAATLGIVPKQLESSSTRPAQLQVSNIRLNWPAQAACQHTGMRRASFASAQSCITEKLGSHGPSLREGRVFLRREVPERSSLEQMNVRAIQIHCRNSDSAGGTRRAAITKRLMASPI
jgi:hypothetical protein